MTTQTDNMIYGLKELRYKSKILGYIDEESFDWGGEKGTSTQIRAAQVPGYPVKIIPKTNGTVKPKFDLINPSFENMADTLGGTVIYAGEGEAKKAIGWKAPKQIIVIEGPLEIDTYSGHRFSMPRAMITANIGGQLNLTSVSKVNCELEVMQPLDGSEAMDCQLIADIPQPTITTADSVALPKTAGTAVRTVKVSTNQNWKVEKTNADTDWFTVEKEGEKVKITYQANETAAAPARDSSYVIKVEGTEATKTVPVTQAANA